MSWTYVFADSTPCGVMDRCEECTGAIRDRVRLERRLLDGQRWVVEPVHIECASTIELRQAMNVRWKEARDGEVYRRVEADPKRG